ncbi:hypothetical protein HUN08_02960 [Gordonia sp. X0973]|uniref:hypothetical protein n=1 Tax=Gordonia sp. X0973 TaxID=2742602 RepID=UPI000F5265EB|nr:hypothetical protein [Gordonia sp. X0973]QKT06271.1 hypothetical protein HUN08_02960 [Gordonia sp. X0973]
MFLSIVIAFGLVLVPAAALAGIMVLIRRKQRRDSIPGMEWNEAFLGRAQEAAYAENFEHRDDPRLPPDVGEVQLPRRRQRGRL